MCSIILWAEKDYFWIIWHKGFIYDDPVLFYLTVSLTRVIFVWMLNDTHSRDTYVVCYVIKIIWPNNSEYHRHGGLIWKTIISHLVLCYIHNNPCHAQTHVLWTFFIYHYLSYNIYSWIGQELTIQKQPNTSLKDNGPPSNSGGQTPQSSSNQKSPAG